jgi:hypothetical protein
MKILKVMKTFFMAFMVRALDQRLGGRWAHF